MYVNFAFPNIFKTKYPKSEEKLHFGSRWVCVFESAPTQSKLCGDALAEIPKFLGGGTLLLIYRLEVRLVVDF